MRYFDQDHDDLVERDDDIDPIITLKLTEEDVYEKVCEFSFSFMNSSTCMIDYKSPAQSGLEKLNIRISKV